MIVLDTNLLVRLLTNDNPLQFESPAIVRQALALYEIGPADFSDYLLAKRTRAAGFAPVRTLYKKIAKTATYQLLR